MKDVWISCASSLSSRNGVSFAICPSTIRTSKPWLLWLLGLPQLCLFLPCLPLPALLLRFFEDYFSLQTWLQVMRVDFWWYLDTLVRNMAWTSPPSWGPLKGYARLVWYGCPRGGRLWKRVDSRASSRDCCQHLRCIRGLRKSINWHWINSTSLLALWGRLKSCHVRFVNAPKDTCEIVGQPIPSKRAGSLAWNFFDGLSRAGVWCWLASAVSGWGVVDDDSWLVLNGLEQFKGIQIAFRSCNPWVCVFFFGGVVLDCFIFFLGLIGKSKINQKYIASFGFNDFWFRDPFSVGLDQQILHGCQTKAPRKHDPQLRTASSFQISTVSYKCLIREITCFTPNKQPQAQPQHQNTFLGFDGCVFLSLDIPLKAWMMLRQTCPHRSFNAFGIFAWRGWISTWSIDALKRF